MLSYRFNLLEVKKKETRFGAAVANRDRTQFLYFPLTGYHNLDIEQGTNRFAHFSHICSNYLKLGKI